MEAMRYEDKVGIFWRFSSFDVESAGFEHSFDECDFGMRRGLVDDSGGSHLVDPAGV